VATQYVTLPATGNPAQANANPGDNIQFLNDTGVTITDFATWTSSNPGSAPIFAPMPPLQTIAILGTWTTPTINGSAKYGYTYSWGNGTPGDTRNGTIDVS
jgi:hypothetical protein